MLLNLARAALQMAQWPAEVQTGRFAFELGEGPRYVKDPGAEGESSRL